MPTYDMRCSECDTVFEVRRSPGDLDDVCCPDCGGATKRVFTPVGVVFKGSGFHNTDYRPKTGDAKEASAEGGSCPSKDSSSPECSSCPASGK